MKRNSMETCVGQVRGSTLRIITRDLNRNCLLVSDIHNFQKKIMNNSVFLFKLYQENSHMDFFYISSCTSSLVI